MLLQRLVEYARRGDAAPPFHQERAFSWQLNLTRTGVPVRDRLRKLAEIDGKGRARPVTHLVPSVVRTVGAAANLAADDAQYVLGWGDENSKPERVRKCHAAFVDLVQRWAESEAGQADPVAQAVWAFYRDGHLSKIQREPKCAAKSGVLIAVDGKPAYRAPSVAVFWAEEVARRKGAGDTQGACLVCGQVALLWNTLPTAVPFRLVPGASRDAALVSVNERVFGYDLTTQLVASPICITCGEGITAGLVRVLNSSHSTDYGGQDSRTSWWLTADSDIDPKELLHHPSLEQVGRLLRSVSRGRPRSDEKLNLSKFCSLTIGGNISRVVVRDWVEMPLEQIKENIAAWFSDHEIVSIKRDGERYHGLGQLALVSGRWIRDRNRYADFGAKGADRPDGVYRDLVRTALRRSPLPPSLLAHLIHRIRADRHLDDARAALIRLALVRHPSNWGKPLVDLDHANTTPAYVAGRIFAVLEQIQYDVSGGEINTTYGDRFFAGAISNPRAALVSGRRNAIAWLRKLRNSKEKKGVAISHEKRLDELFGLLDPNSNAGIPARTTLREQSLFLLGYHHQRAEHFEAARQAASAKKTNTSKETA